MDRIIAGRFQTRDEADVVAAMLARYMEAEDIRVSGSVAVEQSTPGVTLSAHIIGPVDERRVIATLRSNGAAGIERVEGVWRDADRADCQPVEKQSLV